MTRRRKAYTTTQGLIADGKLIADGFNYRTDDGRLIERYEGRGKSGRYVDGKWKVENVIYRSLYEAYEEISCGIYMEF